MTREQYLEKQVLDLINLELLPRMRNSKGQDDRNRYMSFFNMLYTSSRVHPLQLLLMYGRVLTNEEWDLIMKTFEEENYITAPSDILERR